MQMPVYFTWFDALVFSYAYEKGYKTTEKLKYLLEKAVF